MPFTSEPNRIPIRTFYIILLTVLIQICTVLRSDAQEYLYETGLLGGASFYMGDANHTQIFRQPSMAGSLLFRYNHNFRWAFRSDLSFANLRGNTKDNKENFIPNESISFRRSLINLGVGAEFNFLPYSNKYAYMKTSAYTPYLLAGVGASVFIPKPILSPNVMLGIGFKCMLSSRLNIMAEWNVRKYFTDAVESGEKDAPLTDPYKLNASPIKNGDYVSMLSFGISFTFGVRKKPCNKIEPPVHNAKGKKKTK